MTKPNKKEEWRLCLHTTIHRVEGQVLRYLTVSFDPEFDEAETADDDEYPAERQRDPRMQPYQVSQQVETSIHALVRLLV